MAFAVGVRESGHFTTVLWLRDEARSLRRNDGLNLSFVGMFSFLISRPGLYTDSSRSCRDYVSPSGLRRHGGNILFMERDRNDTRI